MNSRKNNPLNPPCQGEIEKGFTLVELIVVVTILAILATIGFVSYSSYLTGVRDTNRLAQLVSISDGLELYSTRNNLPLPDDNVEVQANGETIAYQGYVGVNTLETIDFSKGGQDPRDNSYFTYYLTDDRKYFQLMGFLEEGVGSVGYKNNFISGTLAVDYLNRIPTVYGRKLGILTDEGNTPIQEISEVQTAGSFDILVASETYKLYITETEIVEGSADILQTGLSNASCKRLRQSYGDADGIFTVIKDGVKKEVYCDVDYPNVDLYLSVEDSDMEDTESSVWLGNSAASKTTEDANSGTYSLVVNGITDLIDHTNLMLVDPNKIYKISGYMKSDSSPDSRIYFGFLELDENLKTITNHSVSARTGTETYLTEAVSAMDTQVKFYCDDTILSARNSTTVTHRFIAFDTDNSGSYNDLPNFNLTDSKNDTSLVTKSGNECTFILSAGNDVNYDFPVDTNIRLHISGASRNYVAAAYASVPTSWTKYEGTTSGIAQRGASYGQFRPGTKFIKPFILANRTSSSGNKIFIDDVQIEEF